MNTPANVAPRRCPTQRCKFRGHRAGLAAPPATCAQRTASEYWRPFSCKVRFGSSFIFGSSRITPSSPHRWPASLRAALQFRHSHNPCSRTWVSAGFWCPSPHSGIDSCSGGLTIPGCWRRPCGKCLVEKPGSGRGCVTRGCGGLSTDPIEPIAGSTMPVVSSLRQALRVSTLHWSMM